MLIVWSLARGYFPAVIEGLATDTAIWLAIAGAIGLFASIIFHEFAHALVARRFDMPISGITLFLFGGVAHLRDEPPSARAEFLVAIAGPISSYILAAGFYLLLAVTSAGDGITPLAALFSYLTLINAVLATFNLLPAFPLDGGRVLRAAVWGWTGSLRRATQVSAALGRGLGVALMALGVINIVSGDFVGGLWIGLIGFFILTAAGSTAMQVELKQTLKDIRVRDIMNSQVIAVPADITVAELVDDYFYRHFHKAFPVVRGEQVLGSVRLKDVGQVPRENWGTTSVAEILSSGNGSHVVEPGALVWDALTLMKENNVSRLMVVERGDLKGMLTMRDLMHFLAVHRELSGGPGASEPELRQVAEDRA
ncbi:site-2 protease family protein [Roseibium salinum]|uniref:site-2 protease family protein n=1 Tax=Roseibium salinum TaxID=1604349 RepID=UPI0029E333A9|nr:site-2 protease family protein [Roseibium salinum]